MVKRRCSQIGAHICINLKQKGDADEDRRGGEGQRELRHKADQMVKSGNEHVLSVRVCACVCIFPVFIYLLDLKKFEYNLCAIVAFFGWFICLLPAPDWPGLAFSVPSSVPIPVPTRPSPARLDSTRSQMKNDPSI